VADELRIDTALPDAPRDQLRVLAAEVDNENGAIAALRKRNDDAIQDGNSATPS
jgi:hypothetical protein